SRLRESEPGPHKVPRGRKEGRTEERPAEERGAKERSTEERDQEGVAPSFTFPLTPLGKGRGEWGSTDRAHNPFLPLSFYFAFTASKLLFDSLRATMAASNDEDEWGEWCAARVAAIETILGPSDEMVGHAPIPFHLGAETGGDAGAHYFQLDMEVVVLVQSD